MSAEHVRDIDRGDAVVGGVRRPGSDVTLERLRAKILSGELRPGAVVSQTKLARELGVSTTPLREVIRQLQAEGLLEIELNRRPRVAPLDFEDLNGVYAVRIVVESLAISLTVPADDRRRPRGARDRPGRDADAGDRGRPVPVERGPQPVPRPAGVCCAGGDRGHAGELRRRAERYRQLDASDGQVRGLGAADHEHQRIVEACVAGDAPAAASELANHLARTALYLSAAFATEIDPSAVRMAVGMVMCGTPPESLQPTRRRTRRSR